jgi:hypothetical protein
MKDWLIVMGIAPCLEEDLAEICYGQSHKFDFLAVGMDCSDRVKFPIQHAATYHPNEFPIFKDRRNAIGGNLDYMTHSHANGTFADKIIIPDRIWPLVARHPESGSSAYLGCQVGVGLGYLKIVLCGCPMAGPNLIKPKTNPYDAFQEGWIKHAHLLQNKVRSMSGWTRDFLGYPEKEWLNSK